MTPARVLLVVPVPVKAAHLRISWYPPRAGLASIAAYLLSQGVEVRVFDGKVTPSWAALREEMLRFRPGWVGLSAFTEEISDADRTAAFVRSVDPEVTTVVGGPHATHLPLETLEEFPGFDIAVIGEGEKTLHRIVEAGPDPDRLAAIPGIAHRTPAGVVLSPPCEGTLDLNELPMPAWHLFDLKRHNGLAFGYETRVPSDQEFGVELTRGCPLHCTFCSHFVRYDARKTKAVSKVVEEIGTLVDSYGAKRIAFYSDTFSVKRQYTLDLCAALRSSGLHERVSWACSTRVDWLDPELIREIARSGCRSVFLGVESGSPRILKSVRKEVDFEQVASTVDALRKAGLFVVSNFMIGFPDETREEALATIDLALRLNLDAASFGILVPFAGAAITRELEASIPSRVTSREWSRYDSHSGAGLIRRTHLSPVEVMLLVQWANARFWLRPGYLRSLFRYVDTGTLFGHGVHLAREGLGMLLRRTPSG